MVSFPEARHLAEGLVGQPTYANVSKISLQQSQSSNNRKQPVPSAQVSAGRTHEGPTPTPGASPGLSRSFPSGPRSTPRSSPRRLIQLNTDNGKDVIQRPIHQDPIPEYSLQVRNLREKLRHKFKENFGGHWKSPRNGNEELGAAEETPAKIAATETDSESEDFLSNTVNSDMSSGEEDPMDHNPPILPPQTEQKAHGIANTHTSIYLRLKSADS